MSQSNVKNKKIYFDDGGGVIPADEVINSNESKQEKGRKRTNKGKLVKNFDRQDNANVSQKWFEVYSEYNTNNEVQELKEHELIELRSLCKSNFDSNLPQQIKKNPSDAKWLETALHKGTSKDRANAGALLVQSNPLGNLQALETLITLSKLSNKSSSEVITVLSEVFLEALLPSYRKLISLNLRGADWKALKKREDITNDVRNKVLTYWHFENELKDQYFEFLKNLQASIQTGQESNKNVAIIAASKLLITAPEKEQMILSMLINKLGDPSNKIASKALYHLSEVAVKHPNMCGVIIVETEKLLFRNNISEKAQHFALCFLSQIAPRGHSEVCAKLVNICFDFFKVLVQKGLINNKTMQAILRCLQKAVVEVKANDGKEIMTKDMEDTIYRLVHLADIQVSIQTLSLLLQLITVQKQKSERFYNALYKKMLDMNLTTVGAKLASQFLHIVHRAIHIDQNLPRAQAFVKRLLQIALYMQPQVTCGCLIVINKLLKSKPELQRTKTNLENENVNVNLDLSKFDSDGEETYQDVHSDNEENQSENINGQGKVKSSWHHVKIFSENEEKSNTKEISPTTYNPYHRVPSFCGAEFAILTELHALRKHFNPTVQVFTENIIERKTIDYYGDPLRDFSLTHFLERFAFKNPKKLEEQNASSDKSVVPSMYNKSYLAHGGRGQPVTSLTKKNCTEDELFIFNYLEKKREKQVTKTSKDDDDVESVDDDEFDDYLDGLCKKDNAGSDDEEDFDVDYMKELGNDLYVEDKKKSKKKGNVLNEADDKSDDDGDDWEDDVPEEDDDDENDGYKSFDDDFDSNDEGSISLDDDASDDGNDSGDSSSNEDDEDLEPKLKRGRKTNNKRGLQDMSSLFAAADDFAELLEDTGKIKGHGTSNEIFNKDKSSVKQLKWEEKRRSKPGKFKRR